MVKKRKYRSKIKRYIIHTNPKGERYRFAELADGRIVTVSYLGKKKRKKSKTYFHKRKGYVFSSMTPSEFKKHFGDGWIIKK